MAQQLQNTIIKSSLGVEKIKKSVITFRKSINSTRNTASKINTSIENRNRQKEQAIRLSVSNFQKRREAVRRREREDIIESSGISGAIRRQSKVIASSTRGFLGRILDFIGTIMIGWLLKNLPYIMNLGEQLIDRMRKLFGVLRSFMNNVTTILSGFNSLLFGTIKNFINFDFNNQKQLIDSSLSTIQTGVLGIERDFNNALDLLSQPLDLGFDTLDVPDDTPIAPPPDVSTGSGGGEKFKPLLDLIASGESTSSGGYDAMYPGRNTRKEGKPVSEMTISQAARYAGDPGDGRNYAVGRYQFTTVKAQAKAAGLNPDKDLFSPENQDRMAVHIIENKRKGKDWLAGKITDEQFSEYLAGEWGAFRSASGYVLPGNTGSIGFNKLKPVLQKIKSTPAKPSTPSPSTPLPRSRVIDEIDVSGPKGGLPDVGLSDGGGEYGAPRKGRRHAGIDIGTSGQKGWLVGFKSSGTVTYAGPNGGYGLFVIIRSGNTEYCFAHLARIFVKKGPYNGEAIGEIGNTGGNYDIHLHYEVRVNGSAINPRPYLKLLDIGRKTVATVSASNTNKTPAAQIASAKTEPESIESIPQAQIASAKPASMVQTSSELKTERMGQTIFVPISNQGDVAQSSPSIKKGSGLSLSGASSGKSGLNRYIEQTQYLSLA